MQFSARAVYCDSISCFSLDCTQKMLLTEHERVYPRRSARVTPTGHMEAQCNGPILEAAGS